LKGVKLYTAEWYGSSKGWKLNEYWSYRYLEKCEELGVKNIHVHKGPTIWPLNRDAFDVHDVDHAASHFPELNFIVEHCGLARLYGFEVPPEMQVKGQEEGAIGSDPLSVA